jgi:hypothetical protein
LLTGLPAGARDESGEFPEGSVNQRVRQRLVELAGYRRSFAAPDKKSGKAGPENDEGEAADGEEST